MTCHGEGLSGDINREGNTRQDKAIEDLIFSRN